jgi:selenocysteine-specific translation elongation factor
MIRQISHAIDQIEARLTAAEAPYVAEEREIEQAIDALKARLRAVYEARCEVARPFEIELDRFYDQQNQEEAA